MLSKDFLFGYKTSRWQWCFLDRNLKGTTWNRIHANKVTLAYSTKNPTFQNNSPWGHSITSNQIHARCFRVLYDKFLGSSSSSYGQKLYHQWELFDWFPLAKGQELQPLLLPRFKWQDRRILNIIKHIAHRVTYVKHYTYMNLSNKNNHLPFLTLFSFNTL